MSSTTVDIHEVEAIIKVTIYQRSVYTAILPLKVQLLYATNLLTTNQVRLYVKPEERKLHNSPWLQT